MASPMLIKHPSESRVYTADFSGGPNMGPRGTVWSESLLNSGDKGSASESFQVVPGLPLPYQLITVPAVPTITVTRKDGLSSDLTMGIPFVTGNWVQVNIAGGTDKVLYTVTIVIVTNAGNILTMQGPLLLRANLP